MTRGRKMNLPESMQAPKRRVGPTIVAIIALLLALAGLLYGRYKGAFVAIFAFSVFTLAACAPTPKPENPQPVLFGNSSAEECLAAANKIYNNPTAAGAYCLAARGLEADRAKAAAMAAPSKVNPCDAWIFVPAYCQNNGYGSGGYTTGAYAGGEIITVGSMNTQRSAGARPYTEPRR